MSRRKEDKGRLTPFVPYLKETMREPAWKIMSLGARLLYLHIKARYNLQAKNNGRIYLPTRMAAKELSTSPNQIGRWFRELQHYGWIVMMDAGGLGVEGKGRAPKWRLTELGYMNDPPARDYARWKGDLFVDRKPHSKKCPDTENRIRVIRKTVSLAIRKTVSLSPASDTENRIKGNDISDTENRIKSSLTTGVARVGSDLDAEVSISDAAGTDTKEAPAHAPIGHNAGPPMDQDDLIIPAFLRRTSLH